MKANATAQNTAMPAANFAIQALIVLAFTFGTALAAQIRITIPGTVVPVTLQTAVVVLAGMALGSRKGALSQALYVAAGALGVPFFAGASGAAALFGPTGGYLIGFVLSAWLAGRLNASFGGSFVRAWMVAFVASLAVFAPGVVQLKIFMGSSWSQAVAMGLIPFIVGDLAKTTLVAATLRLVKRRPSV